MAHLTSNKAGQEAMVMVSAAEIAGTDEQINAIVLDNGVPLSNLSPGTMIYTAGYAVIKQKGLDGAWSVL